MPSRLILSCLLLVSSGCAAAAVAEPEPAPAGRLTSSLGPGSHSPPEVPLPREVPTGAHRVAAIQYEIRGQRSLDAVLEEAEQWVERAAGAGAELVIFPELFVFDVWPEVVEDEPEYVRQVAARDTPVLLERLGTLAVRRSVAILAGSVPELRDERLYNSAHLFFADGRRARQDKVFLTAWGRAMGMTPGARLEVFDAPWGRTAILVCYDVEFPALSSSLSEARPELLLVPSMTESPEGYHRVRWSAQARAVEHHAFVVIAGTVGHPSESWRHFGQAAFLTPQAPGFPGLLREGPFGAPAIVLADLDLASLRRSRARSKFYPAKDELERRP